MSTENPDTAENTDELFATLDTAPASADDEAHSPSIETSEEPESRSRAPPISDDPPRGATRSMGGTCPDCGGPMVSRLRAEYDRNSDRPMAQLRLQGVCDDCDLWLEGETPAIRLGVREI